MPSDPTQPHSTYIERLPQVKREIRLFRDRVEILAKWTVGKDYTTTVQLGDLKPDVKRFFVRNKWFKRSIMIGSLAVAAAVVFTKGDYPDWVQRNALFGWVVGIGCAAMAFITFPKRQFARFSKKDGRPGLDICAAGPDKSRFEDFIKEIQRRIRNA